MPDDSKPAVFGAMGGFAKLDKFDGQGNVERFLDHFDVVARANGWTSAVQALQLPTALCGPAFDFFRRLPAEEKETAKALQESLRKEYSATALESDYALLFVSRRRHAEESLPDFGDALKTLARKAYPSFTEDQLESLCKTHFINGGLSDTLRAQLLLGGGPAESYRDLIARARRLEQVFAPAAVRRVPVEQDELRSELQRLTGVVSALEHKVEALSVYKSPYGEKRAQYGEKRGQYGEKRAQYGEKKKPDHATPTAMRSAEAGAQRNPIICFRCRQPGHMARGCANFE